MKNFLLVIFLLSIVTNGFAQDKQSWKFIHPLPQSNNLRKIKALDASTWFAGGANGTYMKTSNAGVNWYFHHQAGKFNAAQATTYVYDMWFFDANTGVVVGDQGYIGRTTNGGVTFDSVGVGLIPTNSRCWAVWFANANTGYIGAGSQTAYNSNILKTTNGGINWTNVYTSTSNYIYNIAGYDENNVIGSWSNGTLIRTTNGGLNWTETPNAVAPFTYNISFLNSTTGFATGSNGLIRRTTNAGANWDSIVSPQLNWSFYQIKPVSSAEIYAVGDPGFLYKTTDLGNSWISLAISVPDINTYIWYSVDKAGANLIISGDYGVVAKSTDGGNTWSSNHTQYNTQIVNGIFSLPGSGKIWFAGRPSSTGKQILYTSNNGNNWIPMGTGGTEEFFGISMINGNTGYASANNSKVFKTTDGGNNWVMMTQPSGSNYSLYSMEFINENTGWVCVNYSSVSAGNVFKTTNGGINWSQHTLAVTNPGSIMSCDFVNENTGFVSINSSNKPVYKTTDGGLNWTPYTTGLTGLIYKVRALDSNLVFAVTSAGTNRVAKSTNGGVNWTLILVPVVADYRSIDFKDANTGYICGNSTTVVSRTTDGGTTWSFQNVHTITTGNVFVTSGDTAYVTGGLTSILRAAGNTLTGVRYNGNIIPNNYELKQNYPNPFNPSTTIEFNLPEAGLISIKIFDITGREINSEINNLSLNAGNFKYAFNGSSLSSGIYFYSLSVNGNIISTKKMLLIK